MNRLLIVLLLTFGISVGVVGNAAGGPCAVDDCGFGGDDDHGDTPDETKPDDCPPFCGGCLRLPAVAAPRVVVVEAAVQAQPLPVVAAPSQPHVAPPDSGLFRPPRA